jgi:hypothetical protein
MVIVVRKSHGKPNLTAAKKYPPIAGFLHFHVPRSRLRVYVPFIAILKLPFKLDGHDRPQQAGKTAREITGRHALGRGPHSDDEAA